MKLQNFLLSLYHVKEYVYYYVSYKYSTIISLNANYTIRLFVTLSKLLWKMFQRNFSFHLEKVLAKTLPHILFYIIKFSQIFR